MCGAIASRSSTGVIAPAGGAPGPAARARASVSSLAQAPSLRTAPAATGFIGATRSPRARRACTSAQATSVLPTPVSVPVTNTPRLIAEPSAGNR